MEQKYILYIILAFLLGFLFKSLLDTNFCNYEQSFEQFFTETTTSTSSSSWTNQTSGFLGSFRNGPESVNLSDDGVIQVSLGRDGGPNAGYALWISTNRGESWSFRTVPYYTAFCMTGDCKYFYLRWQI